MPVRKIPIGTRALTGQHARTGGKYESGLERDFFELVSQDPMFKHLDWQPLHIYYGGATGRDHRYTPDALVTFNVDPASGVARRPLLAEVKYRSEYRKRYHELKDRLRAARKYANAMGWQFLVVTEREIRTIPFANRHFLNGYADRIPDSRHVALIEAAIGAAGNLGIKALLVAIDADPWKQAAMIPAVWWLLSQGRLETDFSIPLTMKSEVCLPRGTHH